MWWKLNPWGWFHGELFTSSSWYHLLSSDNSKDYIWSQYKIVDALVTNFHLSESTLLMLVSAFAGHKNTMAAYKEAVGERYRFFSYGDSMFITKNPFAPSEQVGDLVVDYINSED